MSQGQLLAVSPYESHLDERLFGNDALEFNPLRPPVAGISGVAGVGGIAGIAFGGGQYRYDCSTSTESYMHRIAGKDGDNDPDSIYRPGEKNGNGTGFTTC